MLRNLLVGTGMTGLLITGRTVVVVVVGAFMLGLVALGLVALLRCDKKDLPEIVRALASWWHRSRGDH